MHIPYSILIGVVVLSSGAAIALSGAAKFPAELPQCTPDDNACLERTMTHVIQTYPNGLAGLNIPPLDPLTINSINIVQGAQSPIAIHLQLRDQQLVGISKGHIAKVDGFNIDPQRSDLLVVARIPLVTLRGNYTIQGRVLVLPIQGDGQSLITLADCDFTFRFKPQVFAKAGRQYIRTDKFKLDFTTQKFGLHFTNLFNGDKALGDNMNRFVNENSNDILAELKPSISLALEQIFEIVLNRIFAKVPYAELFKKQGV